MLLFLLFNPIIAAIFISCYSAYTSELSVKGLGLSLSIINLYLSSIIFMFYDSSTNQFQFVEEFKEIGDLDLFLGVDGLSVFFILLTAFIMPISLLCS